jgi:hypothetical protein
MVSFLPTHFIHLLGNYMYDSYVLQKKGSRRGGQAFSSKTKKIMQGLLVAQRVDE